jgi:hypothetical protein
MQTKKTIIIFEHDEHIDLHELLCKTIHENDIESLTALCENVVNIVDDINLIE